MCKGSFPELQFSDVRCTFRPSSSLESSQRCSSQHEKDVEDVHYLKRRTFCKRKPRISSGGDGDGIPSTVPLNHVSIDVLSSGNKRQIRPKTARLASRGKSCTVLITLSLPREEKVQSIEHKTTGLAVFEDISSTTTTLFKMRPTTGREARLERISCNDLLPLTSSKQSFNSSNKGKKNERNRCIFTNTETRDIDKCANSRLFRPRIHRSFARYWKEQRNIYEGKRKHAYRIAPSFYYRTRFNRSSCDRKNRLVTKTKKNKK